MPHTSIAPVAGSAELTPSRHLMRVAVWVGVAVVWGACVALMDGGATGAEYVAAYLLELSLSVDNIFVFVIVFAELRVPPELQGRVLWWGITGALVFRALMIGAGISLVQRFDWINYPFAVLILFTAWRAFFATDGERRLLANACSVCWTWGASLVPFTPVLDGHRFWRREGTMLVATPLFVALVATATT